MSSIEFLYIHYVLLCSIPFIINEYNVKTLLQTKKWWSLQHDWLLFNKPFYKQSVANITKDIKYIDL